MKVAIFALGLCALVALVKAESCSMASDCMNLNCAGMEACEAGLCTCKTQHGNHGCVTATDCANSPMMHGHCRANSMHCVDGHCHCTHGNTHGGN